MKETIVFVHPNSGIYSRYSVLSFAGGIEPPLGLCFLAASVKEKGFKAVIIDAQALNLTPSETVEAVLAYKPRYAGITAATFLIQAAGELAAEIKRLSPGISVIIGGPHVSGMPRETLRDYPCFDAGVVGEGEESLCVFLENGGMADSVAGLAFLRNGGVVVNGRRPLIENIDSLPFPALDLLPDINKYYRLPFQSRLQKSSFAVITSRGCRGKCEFCSRSVFGGTTRAHSVEYVMEMLEYLRNEGMRNIIFEDDDLFYDAERAGVLCERMIENNLRFSWSCCCRVDSVNGRILRLARRAGCWQVMVGVESGEQKILNTLNKGIRLDMVKDRILAIKKAGLMVKGFFMCGMPGETPESLLASAKFAMRLPLDDISMTFFTPFPGSSLWNKARGYGYMEGGFEKFSCFEPVFIPRGMKKEDLLNARQNLIRSFYLRPRVILSYFRRARSIYGLLEFLRLSLFFAFNVIFSRHMENENEKFLLVTAQDFGLSKGVNDGIIDAVLSGIVTGVSLLACGDYFEDAVIRVKDAPPVKVGLHFCLVAERPVLPPRDIPSIVDKNGKFKSSKWRFLFSYFAGRISLREVEAELEAQINKAEAAGVKIEYFDSHCYTHLLPGIAGCAARLAQRHNVNKILFPRQSCRLLFRESSAGSVPRACAQIIMNVWIFFLMIFSPAGKYARLDESAGFVSSGHLREKRLIRILKGLKPGVTGISCHPGLPDQASSARYSSWKYEWEEERNALVSGKVKDFISQNSIKLLRKGNNV